MTVGVVADHLRADHHRRLGDDRIDLARHDRGARLQRRQHDLAESRLRPAVHPAQIVGDLHQADRVGLELAAQLDGGILRRLRGEMIVAPRRTGKPVTSRELGRDLRAEFRMGVDAGADCRAAERQFGHARQRRFDPLDRQLDLRRPTADLLTERGPASHPSDACGRS